MQITDSSDTKNQLSVGICVVCSIKKIASTKLLSKLKCKREEKKIYQNANGRFSKTVKILPTEMSLAMTKTSREILKNFIIPFTNIQNIVRMYLTEELPQRNCEFCFQNEQMRFSFLVLERVWFLMFYFSQIHFFHDNSTMILKLTLIVSLQ